MECRGHSGRNVISFDLPPAAIIIPRPVTSFRFIINDGKEHDCGPCLPRDLAAMPRVLRATVAAREIRPYLPEPYQRWNARLNALGSEKPSRYAISVIARFGSLT